MGEGMRRFETSSRCVTMSSQAMHNFEVTDFSLLDGMGAGKFVSSRTFSAGGYGWNIRIYPDGWKEEDKATHVSVFLCNFNAAKDARTSYTFELLEKDGKVSELWDSSTKISHTFGSAAGGFWGYRKFVEKSKLEPLLRRNGDCFTIRCVLTVVIGKSRSEDVDTMAIVPESNMHQQFGQMLQCGKGKDVTFDVNGQLFHAHRCVLAARSPVFQAELFGPMKESTRKPIKVDDMEPSTFEELLHFVYTDSMSDKCGGSDGGNFQNAAMQHLLVAADRYGLDRLRLMCEVKLCHGIDAETVATTLVLAEQHNCARLKDACLKFLASRDVLGAASKTDGFRHLVDSCPLLAVEMLEKIAEAYMSSFKLSM